MAGEALARVPRTEPPAPQEQRQRQHRGDALAHRAVGSDRDVQAGEAGLTAARLAMRDVASEPALVAQADIAVGSRPDDALDALAARAGNQLLVLLGQTP